MRTSFLSKIVVVFNITSADIKTKSADVVLKTTTILKEMRMAQLVFLNNLRKFSINNKTVLVAVTKK